MAQNKMDSKLLNKLQSAGNLATNIASNAYLAAGTLKGIEYLDKMDYSSTTQALATGAGLATIYAANKSGLIKKFSNGVNESIRDIPGKAMPYLRNGILAAYLAGSVALNFGVSNMN
jgi:hypothetical protein